MHPSTSIRLVPSTLIACAALAACGGDASPAAPDASATACARGTLEPDLTFLSPMAGPAVNPATGEIAAPGGAGYVVSSTYLALRAEPAAQQRFGQLMGAISQALQTQPGLLALQLGTSASCGTARTFAVWSTSDAMFAYVTGAAHGAAVNAVAEVSRGDSIVTHWAATSASQVTWQAAAARLAADDGPFY